MGTVVAIIGDTHIGSTTALSLHEWEYETGEYDEGEPITDLYTANRSQDWIYAMWLDYWRHVYTLAGDKHRIITIHMGDVVDGNHHHTVQALPILSAQIGMAIEIMRPVSNLGDLYMLRGTEAHAGEAAQSEAAIAKQLKAKVCAWELILDVDGVIIECAHHGRAGRRNYTSAAASIATEAQANAAQEGRKIPRYVFTAHHHTVDDSGEKVPGTRAISTPSWQLRTAYGYRVAALKRSDIGGVIILPDGSLDLSKMRYYAAPGQRRMIKA